MTQRFCIELTTAHPTVQVTYGTPYAPREIILVPHVSVSRRALRAVRRALGSSSAEEPWSSQAYARRSFGGA